MHTLAAVTSVVAYPGALYYAGKVVAEVTWHKLLTAIVKHGGSDEQVLNVLNALNHGSKR